MDKQKLIDLLNEDLRSELQSIVQYVRHVATIRGPEYGAIVEELRDHLGQEVNHALVLAEQVDFLGGEPETSVPEIRAADDARGALTMDLELEEEQLDRYRQRVKDAEDAGLPDVAEALGPLLEQTQDHVRDLRAALEGKEES